MTDSLFWDGWIAVLTLTCLGLVVWLLLATRRNQRKELTEETTGHNYDGIEELDNPMPRWWLVLFVLTLIFGAVYLAIYPGIWKGAADWSSSDQLTRETQLHQARYAENFSRYAKMSFDEVIQHEQALRMGQRIFSNNCALCHGSDAGGAFGFPNLTDNNWLYGGSPQAIKTTVMAGRQGQMPSWVSIIGEQGVKQVSSYVRSLSGLEVSASERDLTAGAKIFATSCSACHGSDGKGNSAVGAPNLTDNIWLYGASQAQVEYTVRRGRNGVMPAWDERLGEEKVHLVSAYVYSLSQPREDGTNTPAE